MADTLALGASAARHGGSSPLPSTMVYLAFLLIVLLFVIVSASVAIFLMLIVGRMRTRVPYLPVPKYLYSKILELLEINDQSVIYDLGCGDARLLRYLLENSRAKQAVGIEIAPLPYIIAKILNYFSPVDRLSTIRGNFLDVELSNASHVFLYLFPEVMDALSSKLKNELKKGTRVVSCDFEFKEMRPSNEVLA